MAKTMVKYGVNSIKCFNYQGLYPQILSWSKEILHYMLITVVFLKFSPLDNQS
jgi:hypothetical protein